MSAETIARWNAIPLMRPDPPSQDDVRSLKRPRDNNRHTGSEEDSEDDISLVSRSPSPDGRPSNAMDIDKYDEHVQGAAREQITVETKIKSSNKGFLMLASMGWVEGQPLGLSGDGRVDPIPFNIKNDLTGLGKTTQDVRMIESTVAQRRELDSERQTKETEEQRRAREDSVAKRAALQNEITSTLRPFYCELCDKQFKNVAQYDEHTNSYAHHHKARFRDMQAAQRATRNSKDELDKRKEKERKREEKELRKIAKAAGVKMVKPPVSLVPQPLGSGGVGEGEPNRSDSKKPGWASLSSPPANHPGSTVAVSEGKRSGWTTVGAVSSEVSQSYATGSREGWASASSWSQPPLAVPPSSLPDSMPAPRLAGSAPSFRTAGWTSLDTGSLVQHTPMQPLSPPTSISAPPSALPPSTDQFIPHLPPTPAFSEISSGLPVSADSRQPSRSVPVVHPEVKAGGDRPQHTKAPARQETSRSGWQQFRAGAPGRRR